VDRPSPQRAGATSKAPLSPGRSITQDVDAAPATYRLTTISAAVTCALTPAYTLRWHLGPLPTTVLENAILLTVAVFLVETIRQRSRPVWRTPMLYPAALFLVAGAISVAVAPDHRAALGLYRAYFIEPMAFGFVLINVLTTPRRALLIAGGLAVGGIVAGIANAIVVVQALRHHTYDVVNTPPVVIYNTANAVALFLVPVVAFAAAIALHEQDQQKRLAAAALVALGTVCVVLSFSRGGYLALGAVVVALAVTHKKRLIIVGAGIVIAAGLMLVPAIRHRVLTELDFTNGSNTLVGRFHLWSVALQMLKDHPIFGAGLSGFATVIAPYWNPTNADRFTYPHNIVLNSWSETGILGVIAFAWILFTGFRSGWLGWRSSWIAWRPIHLGVLVALIAVVVHGLVDVPYWKNDLSLELWALLGLTLAPAALARAAPHTSP
jgi:putative inorganic carbon (hco3(-)) transporter